MSPYASSPGQDAYGSSIVANLDGHYGEPKPTRRPVPSLTVPRGPVPEFRKLRTPSDLRPKVNAQPAFRRANPEGGFISVRILPDTSYLRSLVDLIHLRSPSKL